MDTYYLLKSKSTTTRLISKYILTFLSCVCFASSLYIIAAYSTTYKIKRTPVVEGYKHAIWANESLDHDLIIKNYYSQRENMTFSELGQILFLNKPYPPKRDRQFQILIWKRGQFLERRHIRYFTKEKHDPFATCSVNNCAMTYEDSDVDTADVIVIHMQGVRGVPSLPTFVGERPANQRWVFLSDESPINTFSSRNDWHDFEVGYFNWSMTLRTESDIPVPYGRTLPLKQTISFNDPAEMWSLIPNINEKRRDVLITIMTSHCLTSNPKMAYIRELEKYLKIDMYGHCGTELKKACPGGFGTDCPKMSNYLFYLAFENSNCKEYITEKPWWQGFHKGSIPIIMGSRPVDCKMFLPPDSYIHVDDYARPIDLARYLIFLNETWDENYLKLHEWRRHFHAANEHGYFGSPSIHYCRICEALNYNNEDPKVYTNLSKFLSVEDNCNKIRTLQFADKSNDANK